MAVSPRGVCKDGGSLAEDQRGLPAQPGPPLAPPPTTSGLCHRSAYPGSGVQNTALLTRRGSGSPCRRCDRVLKGPKPVVLHRISHGAHPLWSGEVPEPRRGSSPGSGSSFLHQLFLKSLRRPGPCSTHREPGGRRLTPLLCGAGLMDGMLRFILVESRGRLLAVLAAARGREIQDSWVSSPWEACIQAAVLFSMPPVPPCPSQSPGTSNNSHIWLRRCNLKICYPIL